MTETPGEAARRFGLAPCCFPFVSRFTDIDGAAIHHVAEGTGRTLLMLHGNPAWSFLFRDLIRGLSPAYRCVAVDLPGFGLSGAPAGFGFTPAEHAAVIAKWLAANDIRDATLVAHDWGGPVGLSAMLRTAEQRRITGLCLGNTWAWPVNGDFHFEWFSRAMGGAIGRFGSERFKLFVNFVMPAAMRRRKLGPDEMAAYRAPFDDGRRRTPLHVFPAQIIGAGDWLAELERDLAGFDGPVALVWPENDIAFRETELSRWLAMFPRAQLRRIPRCGHFLWTDAPADCIAAIRDLVPAA
jgi:haloalkane dehalogenase